MIFGIPVSVFEKFLNFTGSLMIAIVFVPIILAIIIPVLCEIARKTGLAVFTIWLVIALILVLI